MSALSNFLDRHGLDNEFKAKAGLFATASVMAAVALFTPVQANAGQSFIPNRDSPIGGAGMAQRMAMIADRTTDRLEEIGRASCRERVL